MNVIGLYDIKNYATATQNFRQQGQGQNCLLLRCQYPLGE